ncbi:MAG TPA: SRPBCC family protein [Opitutus sp.]|nr:SRPBCC family protein [Opitutus sp.]
MIIKIVVVLAVALALILVIAAFRRPESRVARSIVIDAPVATVFSRVNTLRNWENWSPWAKLDPRLEQTYSGPPAGVGAVSAWSGNAKVGAGRMTVTDSRPYELVRFRLDFLKPFPGTNTAEFRFEARDGHTMVTWSMTGRTTAYVPRLIGMFVNLDAIIGREFDRGLAQLKTLAETKSAADAGAER